MSFADKVKSSKEKKNSSLTNFFSLKSSFLKHRSTAPKYDESFEWNYKPLSDIVEETNEDKTTRIKNNIKFFLEERCESPFTWRPKEMAKFANVSISRLQDKDREMRDDRKFKWRNFVLQLVISYEYYLKKELFKALEGITNLEQYLLKLTSCCEWLFIGIKDVLWHVVTASKAFLLLEMNKIEDADRLTIGICPANTLRRKPACRAGLNGIKAAVFMEYGHDGNLIALEEARRAIKADKTCAEWSFLKGKCMGRIRRLAFCHDEVTKEEVGAFKMAVERDNPGKKEKQNPEYLVHLAQVLREQSLREYKTKYPEKNTGDANKIRKKQAAAFCKYKEAMSMRPDCPHMLSRVAYGFMKLPYEYIDLKLIRETIEKAVELAPKNAMVHHVKGQYYERFGVEADLALEAYAEAAALGNFGSAMDLVRMRYRLNNQFDVTKALKEIVEIYKDPLNQEVAYAQLGSFYLFVKKDLIKSLKFYTKAGGENMDSYAMKSHKPMFIRMRDPVNMFEVLLEELSNNTNWKDFDKESFTILKKFRISLMDYDTPEKKDRLSVARILQMSTERMDKDTRFREDIAEYKRRKKPRKWFQKKKKKTEQDTPSGSLPEETPKQRSNRSNSNSSVDSDYERDRTVHEIREFSLMDKQSNADECKEGDMLKDPFRRQGSGMSNKFSMGRDRYIKERRISSSCSSVSSACSLENKGGPIGGENSLHTLRFSQSNDVSTVPTQDLSGLTIDPVSRDLNIGTRKMSLMSISNEDCRQESSENLSVKDRVIQTYRTSLSYKQDTLEKANLNRSDSSQSLNTGQAKKKKKGSSKNSKLFKSESTQSLNRQQIKPFTSKYLEGRYQSAFGPKDSVEDITRSMTFLPSFLHKSSNTD